MEKYDITDYLKDDKELQKAVIDEFLKEIAELKAENDRLKEEIKEVKKYQYQQEYLDKEIEEMQKALKTLAEGLNKRQILLQEIKEIIKDCDNGKCFTCKYNKEDAENCIENRHNEILDLITKAEEE